MKYRQPCAFVGLAVDQTFIISSHHERHNRTHPSHRTGSTHPSGRVSPVAAPRPTRFSRRRHRPHPGGDSKHAFISSADAAGRRLGRFGAPRPQDHLSRRAGPLGGAQRLHHGAKRRTVAPPTPRHNPSTQPPTAWNQSAPHGRHKFPDLAQRQTSVLNRRR